MRFDEAYRKILESVFVGADSDELKRRRKEEIDAFVDKFQRIIVDHPAKHVSPGDAQQFVGSNMNGVVRRADWDFGSDLTLAAAEMDPRILDIDQGRRFVLGLVYGIEDDEALLWFGSWQSMIEFVMSRLGMSYSSDLVAKRTS